MAQLTNSTRTTPRPYRARGGTFDVRKFEASTVVSTAIIEYGDVVQFDDNAATANHRVRKSSTMANVPNVLSTSFLGIAVEADDSTVSATAPGGTGQNQKVAVCIANKDTEFVWPSKATGAQHASSLVGQSRAIAYDSTLSMFYIDVANSTAGDASLVITELVDDAGTTNGRIAAKFLSTAVERLVSAAY